jgi:3-deoxy-D-manno-octulosonate 8-phosphate phosphatase (KDO 8-P phosphatase)
MSLLQLFKSVTTFVFDVDGVLTDGTLTVLPDGVMARKMNVKDGYALQLAVKRGYHVVIISGGASEEVAERLIKLGVKEVFMRVTDKVSVLSNYLSSQNIS